uniref:Uncharacterized protein n=1 Tax=viral metagenome TaxID=1070528 RepID=A0A6C0E5K1_9ZZZZ
MSTYKYNSINAALGAKLEKDGYNHITEKHMCGIMSIRSIIIKKSPPMENNTLYTDPASSFMRTLLTDFFDDLERDLNKQPRYEDEQEKESMFGRLQLEAILGNFIIMITTLSPDREKLNKFIDKNLLEFIATHSHSININHKFGCMDNELNNLSLPKLMIRHKMMLTLEYCYKNLPLSIHDHDLLSIMLCTYHINNDKKKGNISQEYEAILTNLHKIYYSQSSTEIYSNIKNIQFLEEENRNLKTELEKMQSLEEENRNLKTELEKMQSLEEENKNLKTELEKMQSLEEENKNLKMRLDQTLINIQNLTNEIKNDEPNSPASVQKDAPNYTQTPTDKIIQKNYSDSDEKETGAQKDSINHIITNIILNGKPSKNMYSLMNANKDTLDRIIEKAEDDYCRGRDVDIALIKKLKSSIDDAYVNGYI